MSDVALRARDARRHWAAPGGRHDRVVRASAVLLPVGVGVLAAFLVMAPLTHGGDVSFVLDRNKVAMAHERLRAQAATYRGQDAKGQPFTIDAGEAVQHSQAEPIVRLRQLAARLSLTDGPATLRANRGRYDMTGERLAMDGPVRVDAPRGYLLNTRDATLDLKTRRVVSGGAATGTVPQGVFSADRMSADLETRDVRLDGHARLRIVPRHAK